MSTPPSLNRGVWVAPWTGPNGETVVYAIDSTNRLLASPVVIPHGTDHVALADRLWQELDRQDPVTDSPAFAPPRSLFLPRSRLRAKRLGLTVIDGAGEPSEVTP